MRMSGMPKILFPWESRGGIRRFLGLGRLRPLVIVGGVLGFVTLIGVSERRSAGIRQTRATLSDTRRAVEAHLADHDGGCPESLAALPGRSASEGPPEDAWGRPLRLVCPGRFDDAPYELMSDGPDGQPGGLDRIE